MNALSRLAGCDGAWLGANILHNPMTGAPEDSAAMATVQPILGGRYVQLEYRWSFNGQPQEGFMLVGGQNHAHTLHWIDSWHMADAVMDCKGESHNETEINVVGHYAAGDGPDWGWRTIIKPTPGESLRIEMYNISPEGQQDIAVKMILKFADAANVG